MTIHDQRDIHGARTVEGQHDHWRMYLATATRVPMTPTADARTVDAYVSESRWVANCPECNGGIACWDENPHGCCLDCGHVYPVRFPKDYLAAAALLELRPRGNRHWFPHRGETVRHLEHENRLHLRGNS